MDVLDWVAGCNTSQQIMKLPGKILIVVTPPADTVSGSLAAIAFDLYPQEAGSAPGEQVDWHRRALIEGPAKKIQASCWVLAACTKPCSKWQVLSGALQDCSARLLPVHEKPCQ